MDSRIVTVKANSAGVVQPGFRMMRGNEGLSLMALVDLLRPPR
jgi:hypothetical protein